MEKLTQLNKSNKIDIKGSTAPTVNEGSKKLEGNVDFGKRTTEGTVKPEEVTKNFADSQQFAAEIKQMFPEEYGIVTELVT